MEKIIRNFWIEILLFIGFIVISCLYFFNIRELIVLFFQDQTPEYFNEFAYQFYPRLLVDKQRFEADFFLAKADQVLFRLGFCLFLGLIFSYFYKQKNAFQKYIKTFFSLKISVLYAKKMRIAFVLAVFFMTYSWHGNLLAMLNYSIFYQPISFLEFFQVPFPNVWQIHVIFGIYCLSLLCILLNIKTLYASVSLAILFELMHAYMLSFEKIDHGYVTLSYVILLFPFFVFQIQNAENEGFKTWALPLIRLVLALVYLLSGLEKVFSSGTDWISADVFRNYLLLYQNPFGLWVAESDFLCQFLPICTIFFQLGFVSILFYRPLRFIFLPFGVLFHTGTYLLFGFGYPINAWILMYIFFL
ncbi:MAG: hypothetical protein EAZ97_10025 [Bacteroidetes bacterium]|nr:MAG: hypothetical protein EAZ97_10025 [Bacteroidota bacterium]